MGTAQKGRTPEPGRWAPGLACGSRYAAQRHGPASSLSFHSREQGEARCLQAAWG